MQTAEDQPGDGDGGLTSLILPDGPELLRKLAVSVRRATGAASTFVAYRPPGGRRVRVVAGAGSRAPAVGEEVDVPIAAPPRRVVVPLVVGGTALGYLVADEIEGAVPAEAQRELALLGAAGALALQNHAVLAEADRQAARAAQRHFRLLVGTIYHLKNTLANSSEYLDLLGMSGEMSSAQRDYVERSRRSVDMAMRLLTELHDLGLTDSGELVPEPEPLNISAVVRDLVQDYRTGTASSTVSFVLEVEELPPIRTDGDCVRQVLDTLLSNAVRYSPRAGIITVRAQLVEGRRAADPERWLRLDVADRGPGVAENQEVFEEVQRVSRKGSPGFRLAIARRLARLLGGDLVLDTAPGEGSTFSLWLPLEETT
jgi:signal transduction histidine kinase